jgi:lipopolysaccharide/colanic/teichoic acid biosynthesis glycosyltransferase
MYDTLKRLFDIVFSLVSLVLLSPLFLVVAVLIRLDTKGPVFYRGERVTRGGKLFRMLKFRTMVANADQIGGDATPDDDPRITPVGRVLRRYKLDELPQLIDVLRGKMSIVGPRPQVKWVTDLYTQQEREILTLRPGLTDYASLYFVDHGEILRGSADPEKDYLERIHPKKMRLALAYVRNRSLWVDCKIIVRTLLAIGLRSRMVRRLVGSDPALARFVDRRRYGGRPAHHIESSPTLDLSQE